MRRIAIALFVLMMTTVAHGALIEFHDRAEWEAAVGEFTTLDFTRFDQGTTITEQYAELGAVFTSSNVVLVNEGFLNDGAGIVFADAGTVEFDQPITYVAADFNGFLHFELFMDGVFVGASVNFGLGGSGNFGGVVSSESFNTVVFTDPFDRTAVLDDIFFGPPIPSPATLALIGLAGLLGHRRRRSSS